MELPLYQKHLIDALRFGSKMWMDDFGKTTYHVKINNTTKEVTEQTITSLVWRGLIKMSGNEYILTDLGMNSNIFSPDETKKTLYSI
jgi:hypothetical protein